MRYSLPIILLLLAAFAFALNQLSQSQQQIRLLKQEAEQYRAIANEGLRRASDSTWTKPVKPGDRSSTELQTRPDTVRRVDTVYVGADTTLSVSNPIAACQNRLQLNQQGLTSSLQLTLKPIRIKTRDYRRGGVLRTEVTSPVPVAELTSSRVLNPAPEPNSQTLGLTIGRKVQGLSYTRRLVWSVEAGPAVYRIDQQIRPALQLSASF